MSRHTELETINDDIQALHDKLKGFHNDHGCLDRFNADYCDTTNINGFADDLDGFQADEIAPMLESLRTERDREEERREDVYESMERAESSMLRFRQAGIR